MRRQSIIALSAALLLAASLCTPVLAQEPDAPEQTAEGFTVFADYPARRAAVGDSVTFNLTVRGGSSAETVDLRAEGVPEGWTATFRGGGDVIQAVHVEPGDERSVRLQADVPEQASIETHTISVVAEGDERSIGVPLRVNVEEEVPPRLTLEVDLPTLKGKANTTFRYDATVENEGNEELSLNLIAEAPQGFEVNFKLTGQEVSSFPIAPGESKRLDVEVQPPDQAPGGTYEIEVVAEGGAARASTTLVADVKEVAGEPALNVTGPGGRLSGDAYVGKKTSLKVIVTNTGDAAARNVALDSSSPSGWSVEFEPKEIEEIPVDSRTEVTAKIEPAEKAVAGDYEITVRARPENGTTESAQFRMTVHTSTMWGIVGVGIIAVAVVIVGLAVMRFGRR